jgi:hypothetical protein
MPASNGVVTHRPQLGNHGYAPNARNVDSHEGQCGQRAVDSTASGVSQHRTHDAVQHDARAPPTQPTCTGVVTEVCAIDPKGTATQLDPARRLVIKPEVKDYVDDKQSGNGNRKFPVVVHATYDVDGMDKFLKWMHTKFGKAKSTYAYYVGGVRQFLACFDFEGISMRDVIMSLIDGDVLSDMLTLPILDATIPWTERMMSGMSKLTKHLHMNATLNDDTVLVKRLLVLDEEYIKPRLALRSKASATAIAQRDEDEFDIVMNVADAHVVENNVIQMIVDLATSAHAMQSTTSKADKGFWKTAATVCQTGLIYWAQLNSRPGPWRHLTVDTIEDMITTGRDYWVGIKGLPTQINCVF